MFSGGSGIYFGVLLPVLARARPGMMRGTSPAKVPNATPESANERAGGQPKVPAAWAGGRGAKVFLSRS